MLRFVVKSSHTQLEHDHHQHPRCCYFTRWIIIKYSRVHITPLQLSVHNFPLNSCFVVPAYLINPFAFLFLAFLLSNLKSFLFQIIQFIFTLISWLLDSSLAFLPLSFTNTLNQGVFCVLIYYKSKGYTYIFGENGCCLFSFSHGKAVAEIW